MNPDRKTLLAVALFFAALLVLTFWPSFLPDSVLLTQDDPLGLIDLWKSKLPGAWLANWFPFQLVGLDEGSPTFHPYAILMWLLPSRLFVNWVYAFDTFVAGMFFFLFLRQRRLSVLASLLGAVTYAFGSANFSLVYSGHVGKFGCMAYFAATFWALEHALAKPGVWSWRILTGAFLGLTVAEQPDPALLYVWLFSIYLAFRLLNESRSEWKPALVRFASLIVLSAVVSGLIASQVVWTQFRTQIRGVARLTEETPQQKWDWATQWSHPPEETLALLAPGFFGWRLDHPEGPYWGREGRTADFEKTKQGYPRFKFDTRFVGIVPFALAAAMAVAALRRKTGESLPPVERREVAFWTIAALLALMLAFGRHFPLYRLAHIVPTLNVIRNPAKFMHVFSVALAVLAAYGFHHCIEPRTRLTEGWSLWKILAGLGGLALLGAFWIFGSKQDLAAAFKAEFREGSNAIAFTMGASLLRLAFSGGAFAAFLFFLQRPRPSLPGSAKLLGGLILALATADLYLTNRHYVEYLPFRGTYRANHLIEFLKADSEPHRIKVLPRDPAEPIFGLYNLWLTIYFPYHRIETFDVPQLPRMSTDYVHYLRALDPHTARLWELTGCKYLIGPLEHCNRIAKDSVLGPHCSVAFAYNLAVTNDLLVTSPAMPAQYNRNTQQVLRYERALPRAKFYDRWRSVPDDTECLRLLAAKEFDPQEEVLVSGTVDPGAAGTGSAEPQIEWLSRTYTQSRLRIVTDRRGIVLLNEKHDPAFVVTVDGKRAPLLRCNYLVKGALVEPGTHEVQFEYRPPRGAFYVAVTAWVGCLVAVVLLRWREQKPIGNRQPATGNPA